MKPATVKQIIQALEKLPQDFPCYVRPKYHGTLKWCEEAPIHIQGINEMHPLQQPKNVTFLI